MPNLRHLRLEGQQDKPGIVEGELIFAFTRQHLQMLKTLVLNGVLIISNNNTDSIADTTAKFLNDISTDTKPEKIEVTIYRRDHHGKGEHAEPVAVATARV